MIVLLTDFGESEYVGIMRGVIASISPKSQILDLTHSIPPQSIREGAWVLLKSYRQFPKGAIFVAVVDPGVGTDRAAVIARTRHYTFVGPDNGLLYPVVKDDDVQDVCRIVIAASASRTFHGRDVFARAGGLLEEGNLDEIETEHMSALNVELTFHQSGNEGEIVRIDRFGNIISNIPASLLKDQESTTLQTRLGSFELPLVDTYGTAPYDGLFVLVSSYDTYEIAARNQSAAALLSLRPGDRISIQ